MESYRDSRTVLLAAARAGSVEARETLLESFRTYLWRVCSRRIPANLQAKVAPSDLVQETLHAAHVNFERFTSDTQSKLRAWLVTLATNKLIDEQRKFDAAKRDVNMEIPLDSRLHQLTEQAAREFLHLQAQSHELLEWLDQALLQLTEKQRAVFLLRHDERLTFDAIGQRLGISDVAARRLYQRGYEFLQMLKLANESSRPDF